MTHQLLALIGVVTVLNLVPPATLSAQDQPQDVAFVLEPTFKATARTTRPLPIGTRLEFVTTNLSADQTLILQRCGEPCNTAKAIRTWSVPDFANDRRQLVTIEEPGLYYFWIQRTLPGGEVGPVLGESAQLRTRETTVLYTTGTRVSVTVSPPLSAGGESAGQATVTPLFTRVDESPAFYVECTNDTGREISAVADIWPWAPGRLRIDGQVSLESGGIVSPGLGVTIEPGGVWRGIIALRQSRDGFSASTKFDANVRGARIVTLTAGRHTIAVRCGGVWSAEFAFFWEDESQRAR